MTLTELRPLLRLTAPLAVLQLSYTSIGAVTTAVVGRLGEVPLSAVGLGNALYFGVTVIGLGLVMGFDPLISQAIGAGEEEEAQSLFWQVCWLALFVSAPLFLLVVIVAQLLPWFGVDPESISDTRQYLYARVLSLFPFLLTAAARSYLQARERIGSLLLAAVVSNVVNVPVCIAFTYGYPPLGIPAMGVFGAGLSFGVSGLVMASIMLVDAAPLSTYARPQLDQMKRALTIGAPLAGQLFAEVGAFTIVTVAIGWFGSRALAAHHVALTCASIAFQVSLAIGAAAAVRVGRAIGEGDTDRARTAGFTALFVGGVFTVITSIIFALAGAPLAGLFTDAPEVIASAIPLIIIAAVFQLGDGAQAIAAGALRGAGDTKVTFAANVVGHYVIGLPIGLGLAFSLGLEERGLWWGITTGLIAVAILLTVRFHRLSGQRLERV